jgi:regulatory protein
MKVTSISIQVKDKNRVSVSVDGKYRLSVDVFQLVDLGIKVGNDYTEKELVALETESQFGKLYARALEYCLMRLHSGKEIRDYLYRKTRDTRTKEGNVKKGVPTELTTRVFDRLVEKKYIDDDKFARYWVENRSLTKGISRRKLTSELYAKGVSQMIIDQAISEVGRDEQSELEKIVAKKRRQYPDEQKFIGYLARQGFSYDDIKTVLHAQFESDDST